MAVVVIDMERISSQKLGANLKFESKFEVQQSKQETEKFQTGTGTQSFECDYRRHESKQLKLVKSQ